MLKESHQTTQKNAQTADKTLVYIHHCWYFEAHVFAGRLRSLSAVVWVSFIKYISWLGRMHLRSVLFNDTQSQEGHSTSYGTILFSMLANHHMNIRQHVRWAVSLVIADRIHFIFFRRLCGYMQVNKLALSEYWVECEFWKITFLCLLDHFSTMQCRKHIMLPAGCT